MFPIHLNFFGNYKGFYEGAYFALAALVAILFAMRLAKKADIDKNSLMLLLVVALASGVFGGSLFQQLFYTEAKSLGDVFSKWEGGFSITGGVIVGPILTYLYCRNQKLNFWKLFALVVPAIILGQAVGRLGCFMNGDGHGTATDLPWAVQFPRYGYEVPAFEMVENSRYQSDAWKYSVRNGLVSGDELKSVPVHPSQLYEFLADMSLFFILLWLLKQAAARGWKDQVVPLAYIGGYALIRFFIEFTRADRELGNGQNLSQMQIVLLFVMAGSLVWALMLKKGPKAKIKG